MGATIVLDDMHTSLPLHRFTSDEYHEMARVGILAPDERVELLDGQIVERMTIGSRHAATVDRLTLLVVPRFAGRAHTRVQGPVHLSMLSEPEPDLSLLRRRLDDYAEGPPLLEDVLAIVEVSDSSLALDREEKLLIYARHRIADYWVVNLVDDRIEVHREPHDLGYASTATFRRGEIAAFLAFPGEPLPVDQILPAPKPA